MGRVRPITILLSVTEKARELGVTTETLRRWRRDKIGPEFVEYGGVIRYHPEKTGGEA